MVWIFFIVGFIIGFIINYKKTAYGYIDVDPHTEQVRIHLNPGDLNHKRLKRVVLKVNHDKHISREDHLL